MEAHKDITDMSFEEFFADSKVKAEKKELKERAPKDSKSDRPEKQKQQSKEEHGFFGAGPKVNYTAGRFQLYVPRFTGGEGDQFQAAIDCKQGVIPLGRLEATKQKGARTTRPATLDLTSAGVSPMEEFKLTIDGEEVFVNKERDILFFNNIGIPMAKPAGDVYAVHKINRRLKLVKAESLSLEVKDGLVVEHLDVSVAGGVWLEDGLVPPKDMPKEEPKAEPKAEEPVPEEKPKAAPKKKRPTGRIKGTIALSEPCKDATVLYDGRELPLYSEPFVVNAEAGERDVSLFNIHVTTSAGDALAPSPAKPVMKIDLGDAFGPAEVLFEKEDGKVLAKEEVFLIPGFSCSYEGKGDIVEEPRVDYSMFGEERSVDLFEDDAYGPFERDGVTFYMRWVVPAITYDVGMGETRYSKADINIGDMTGDYMKITVKGARKKALFFGKEHGKKVNLTPDWVDDTYNIDLDQIRDEVYDNQDDTFCLFITVNSFPNRKFITIRNPVRITASYADGSVSAELDQSVNDCVCRLYKLDKSVEEVRLTQGQNSVPVDSDVIEAEIVEFANGKERSNIPVKVRDLPFLLRDETGDFWLYVSRSKRIPLPDELIVQGKPQYPQIKAWHDRIVRMNPELKDVTYAMMQNAFKVLEE